MKNFLWPTLNKIVIAKLLGLPLLAADSMFGIFKGTNILITGIFLLIASYFASCAISHYLQQR